MNILFIGGDGDKPNANSVCVNNMAREMMVRGHKVWILSMGDEPGQIPDTYYGKLVVRAANNQKLLMRLWMKLVKTIRHLMILPVYPDVAPLRSRKVARKADDLVRKNDISLVVTIFNDYENIYAGLRLKEKYCDKIRVVSYHLDLRTASANPSAWIRKIVFRNTLASLRKENKLVDKMLIPYSGKTDIEKIDGLDKNKIQYVGFPVFIGEYEFEKCELPFEKDAINITYIGTLSSDNRNPSYILPLLEQAANILNRKVIVHFWGTLDGVEATLRNSKNAVYHGMIANRYARYLMDNSDFLLNIGNAISYSMLPSKVFGMFATGKPIINVITHPQDATLPYFERYNYSVDVKEYQQTQADAALLAEGITTMLKSPLKDSEGLFDDFKPEKICEIILDEKV